MPDLKEQAEKELIEKARAGDIRTFGELVKIYQERSIRTAFSFLGNWEDARDVAQESFVKAYQSLSGFKGSSKFSTWFYRILMNSCKDFLRKRKSRKQAQFITGAQDEDGGAADPLDRVASSNRNALKLVMDHEITGAISKALEVLPFQQRSAFTLRYLEGMSIREIAENMVLSEGAVKAHLWQAGQKMKESLTGILEIEGGLL